MVLTSDGGSLKVLDLFIAGETGMYLFAEIPKGELRYIQDSLSYQYNEASYSIFLFSINTAINKEIPSLSLLDIEAQYKSNKVFLHPPSRLIAYYPSGIIDYGVPELKLVSHLNATTKKGLIFYNFSIASAVENSIFPTSYNQFITSEGCTVANCERCFVSNPGLCAQCISNSTYYLSRMFTCNISCADGYYSPDGILCKQCHSSCLTCNGPLRNQCTTCTSTRQLDLLTKECKCSATNPYVVNGSCVSTCSSGQLGVLQNGNCKDSCPLHTFYYSDYSNPLPASKSMPIPASEGSDLLQFSVDSTNCLQLPGPTGATSIPNAFTVTFWLKMTSVNSGTLIWGFNFFQFKAFNGYIQLQINQSATIITVSTPTAILILNEWFFVAGSIKNNNTSYNILLYVVQKDQSIQPGVMFGDNTKSLIYPPYINTILVGCKGDYISPGKFVPTPGITFNGNIREFVYMKKYHEVNNLDDGKSRVYGSCLEIYKDVLSYWRFDVATPNGIGYNIKDSSIYAQQASVTANPIRISPGVVLCNSSWDDLGTCLDLFGEEGFPKFSINIEKYPKTGIQYRINLINGNILENILSNNDILYFAFGGCANGKIIVQLSIRILDNGKIQVETNKGLPPIVYGRFVDVCYKSYNYAKTLKFGQLYVPNIPNHIFPSNGATEKNSSSEITFKLIGGDQSIGDIITLYSIDKDVLIASQDSVLVDESASTYATSTMRKLLDGYSSLLSSEVDIGTYTLLWRPSYLIYQTEGDMIEYKNMFTTWTIQSVPRVKFPAVTGMAGLVDNGGNFKGELLYLNLVGQGQMDGDQVIFCYTGCNFINSKGPIFTRINGAYPAIWLGEEFGVFNLLDEINYDRIFICWRPAARASISASDDVWSPVYQESEGPLVNGYLKINNLLTNQYLPEILGINPPITNPILVHGQSVWFKISKCGTSKMKPSNFENTPGKIQIIHIKYKSFDHLTYESEVIWEQLFNQLSDTSSSGFTVGNLQGDSQTCNFTITNLPENMMFPGHTYQLIIYSMSFRSSVSSDYLFGTSSPGLPTFVYWFQYQEADFIIDYQNYIPSQTQIEIKGLNLGDVSVVGSGITEMHRLFGVTLNLTCGDIIIPSSYLIRNIFFDNPSSLRLTDLDLESCNTTLIIEINLRKLGQNNAFPMWSNAGTFSKLEIGTVGCDPSCFTCDGPTAYNCTSCLNDGIYSYLFQGQCLSQCNEILPFAQIIFDIGTNSISYYQCTSTCFPGFYLEESMKTCLPCDPECKTCYSGKPGSCIDCKGVSILASNSQTNDNNTYIQLYSFQSMCMKSCPNIYNELLYGNNNAITYREDLHQCYAHLLTTGFHPISVIHQQPNYPYRLDIKISTILRALINDPTHNLTWINWSSFPLENLTNLTYLNSDERVFLSYDQRSINSSIVSLNMNSFNYRGNYNQMYILLKAYTCDSFAYDFFELIANRPPDITGNITLSQTMLKTLSTFNLTLSGVQDSDDIIPILKFKVLLQPRSLVIPANASSLTATPLNALQILAALPSATILINSVKTMTPKNNAITISNIYIPALINGPQFVSGLTLNQLSCDLYIYCEDRLLALTVVKQTINISESYSPTNITYLLDSFINNPTINLDLALSIAQSFKVAITKPRVTSMSLYTCSRDSQCTENGKCVTSGGMSECVCNFGYTGISCNWFKKDLINAQVICQSVLTFLNKTILAPITNELKANNVKTTDIDSIFQVSTIISGLLQNPEIGNPNLINIVSQLCLYITSIDNNSAGRLLSFQKSSIIDAIDVAIQFIFYSLKKDILEFSSLNDKANLLYPYLYANFIEKRNVLANLILPVRSAFYSFLDKISISQFPGAAAFTQKGSSFEIFISSERVDELFVNLGKEFAIQLSTSFGTIKFPKSILDTLTSNITVNGEFKLRIVNWLQDPFIFSDFHSVVCTNVLSMAILDSNGTELHLNLTEPMIFLLPLTNQSMNFPNDYVKCMYFNNSQKVNNSMRVPVKTDVNNLNLTDAEKKKLYPQWDPLAYSINHLIVDESAIIQNLIDFPDYADSDGISSYGNILRLNEYNASIPCAAFHLSEIAAVVQRKRAIDLPVQILGYLSGYWPDINMDTSLGVYICFVIGSLFCIVFMLSCIFDSVQIPKLEKIIEINRQNYSDTEIETNPLGAQIHKLDTKQLFLKEGIDADQKDDISTKTKKGKKEKDPSPLHKHSFENINQIETKGAFERMCSNSHIQNELTTCAGLGKGNVDVKKSLSAFQDEIKKNPSKISNFIDIFSEDYIMRKEQSQFTFSSLIMNGNIILNLIVITNALFTRTPRCILFFLNIFLHFSWSFLFLSYWLVKLDHPENTNRTYIFVIDFIWIPFITPYFVMLLHYIYAALFKVQESKAINAKSFPSYTKFK